MPDFKKEQHLKVMEDDAKISQNAAEVDTGHDEEPYFGSMTIVNEEKPMLTISPMMRAKVPLDINKQVSDLTFLSHDFDDIVVSQPKL